MSILNIWGNNFMLFPKIGSIFKFDGINWIVVGAGNSFFKYRANKGIFSLLNYDLMDCLIVMIQNSNVIMRIDPTIPSLQVDGKELLVGPNNNGYFLLLKYDRDLN